MIVTSNKNNSKNNNISSNSNNDKGNGIQHSKMKEKIRKML